MDVIKNFLLGKDSDKWWHRWYILDWALVVLLVIISEIVDKVAHPFNRFLPTISTANYPDPAVNYPILPDIVPDWLLVVLAVLVPIAFLLLCQIKIRNHHDFHHALLGLAVSLSLGLVITVPIKYLAGRYRPDFLARYTLNNDDTDARLSFPSGHSSTSFSSLVYISLYIAGKLRVFSDHAGSVFARSIASMLPLIMCTFIAVSRTMDYHHNFSDILAGAMIGFGVAFVAYFLYFPSLFHRRSNVPKSFADLQSEESEKLNDGLPV